jgi:hypothetical protein
MPELHPSIRHIPVPPRIARLPIDAKGWFVPWFVHEVNGVPDHRIVETSKFAPALREKRCWICGEPLGRFLAFALGPMCTVSRTVSEPPSHRACVIYAMQACPFLSRPHMVRREAGLPDDAFEPAGIMEKRNPGVMCLWMTRSYRPFTDHNHGLLFRVGEPTETQWYAEGRAATHQEVQAAMDSGLVLLTQLAQADGPVALRELAQQIQRAIRLLPREAVAV